jgi:hypothetical protein
MNDRHRRWAGPVRPLDERTAADRQAVSQLAMIYALGIDMRDIDLMLSAFDPDGSAIGSVGDMRMEDYLRQTYAGAETFEATQHTMMNQYIDVQGDRATMWTYGVAHHIRPADDPDGNHIVGVQYRDTCERRADGWIVVRRTARMQWVDGVLTKGSA